MFRAPLLPRTLEAALRDLGATKASVRVEAVRDLARLEDDARAEVARALRKALSDPAAEVRAAAATALADIRGVEGLPDLLVAVEDPDVMVRQMAITALGEIGDGRAEQRLRRALADARAEVRFQAVIAYPRVCTEREDAIAAVLASTSDDDPLVAQIALRMAEEVAGEDGEIDARFLVRARALVGHASPEVRVAAAVLLGKRGDAAARAVLASAARGEHEIRDREDVAAAIELVGQLGIDGATAGLEKRAFGGLFGLMKDPFAWHARVALARMGHARAVKEILGELAAADYDVRTLAVAAAGRARLRAARDRIAAMKGDERRADPNAVEEALAALAEPEPAP